MKGLLVEASRLSELLGVPLGEALTDVLSLIDLE